MLVNGCEKYKPAAMNIIAKNGNNGLNATMLFGMAETDKTPSTIENTSSPVICFQL